MCVGVCFFPWFGVFQHTISFPNRAFLLIHFLFLVFLSLPPPPLCQLLRERTYTQMSVAHFLLFIFPPRHQLQLWDTAGQERFRKSMVQHYYRNVHAVLFIYDVTCPSSFSSLSAWVEECRQNSLGQEIPR